MELFPAPILGGKGSQTEKAGELALGADETAQTSPNQVSRAGATSGGSPATGRWQCLPAGSPRQGQMN